MPGDFPNTKDITFAIQVEEETDDGQGGVIESWTNVFTPLTLNEDSPYYTPIDETGVGYYYVIPWSFLQNQLELSKHYDYILAFDINDIRQTVEVYATYGGLTPEDALKNSLDRQEVILNEQLNQFIEFNNQMADFITGQESTTNAINDLNDTISDDTITSSASDLPSINVNDPSANGINNIFNLFYNAFCTGQPQDIVFPIPFTNKNITLSPNYVRDMCNNNGASWIVTFIDAFWQFLVAVFVIRDVSKKINKIKTGDIENIENENIKEAML